MIDEKIDERKLNDMVVVCLVYGLPKIDRKIDDDAGSGKDELVLWDWKKNYPKGDKAKTVKVINKHKLDEVYQAVLTKIPKAVELAKEYFAKPDGGA